MIPRCILSYRTLNTPPASTRGGMEPEPVELVTVPRFGPEWTKDELRAMTKQGKSEEQKYVRQQRWKEWNQDKKGLFGQKWLTRKVLVWVIFVSVILYVSFSHFYFSPDFFSRQRFQHH